MTPDQFQELCKRTSIDEPNHDISGHELMIVWFALGLAGEAGEVSNNIKKWIFHQRDIDMNLIKDELGDCLWYIAEIATKCGFDLSEIMTDNVEKNRKRYPEGWKAAR